jgi:hypothetical protein
MFAHDINRPEEDRTWDRKKEMDNAREGLHAKWDIEEQEV